MCTAKIDDLCGGQGIKAERAAGMKGCYAFGVEERNGTSHSGDKIIFIQIGHAAVAGKEAMGSAVFGDLILFDFFIERFAGSVLKVLPSVKDIFVIHNFTFLYVVRIRFKLSAKQKA